jgi:signal transduction histidine kinase/ligand-binding sensor domain-containing protein
MRFLPRLALPGCLLGLWIGAFPPAARAQSDIESVPRSNDYILRTWDTEDGLPDLGIRDITQTPDGYLWLATWFGLVRFDGVQFTTPAGSSASRPPSASATAVLTAKDGTLWAAIPQVGLARLHGDRLQFVFHSPPSSDNALSCLDEDTSGGIWGGFFSGNTVIRWKHGTITQFHPSTRLGVNLALYTATNGVLWFASNEDCGFLDGGKFRPFPMDNRKGLRLGVARQGGMWAIRGNQLLRLWENGTSKTVAQLPWIGDASQATTVLEDREGNLWIGTLGLGLLRFRDGAFERVPTSFPWIQALYEDREGNLWVGTGGGGLNCLSPRQFFLRTAPVDPSAAPLGPRNTIVRSLATDHEGRLWMSQGYALVRATDPMNRTFVSPPGWTNSNSILSLALDSSDRVWIAEVLPELLCWKNGQLLADTPLPGRLASFSISPQDQVWAATKEPPRGGVYAWRDGTLAALSLEGSGIVNPVCLAWDAQKRLWIGTADGQVYYREGDVFAKVPMLDPDPRDKVVFLVPDGADTVWIGRESGLSRWHAGRLESLPPEAGFPTNDLSVLEIESNGNFWFGLRRSLIRVARADLESAMEGRKLDALPITTYGRNKGIPSALEFQFGFLHSSTRTPDGHLWFATNLGALEVLPESSRESAGPRSVLIEALLVGGKLMHLSKLVELPPRPGSIQIRYTLPLLSAPEQVRFRYRLRGSRDDSWYPVGSQRSATFTNLPPGHYTFEVAATDPASSQPRPATLTFNVQAAWWETLWFRLVCLLAGAVAVAGIVYAILQRRMQARMHRLEQENALDRERARIARDMHDELGAELTHVILMSESAAAKAPSPELQRIATTARSVSSTLDQIVWMTNPRNDTLKQLVDYIVEFAEEYLTDATISLRSELPDEVPNREVSSEKRHHVLLAVKEAVNNVAKHSGATRVHLRIAIDGDKLQIAIRDNGRGFHSEDVTSTSNGLINMRQRMEAAAGEAKIESQAGLGTTVTLSVKI